MAIINKINAKLKAAAITELENISIFIVNFNYLFGGNHAWAFHARLPVGGVLSADAYISLRGFKLTNLTFYCSVNEIGGNARIIIFLEKNYDNTAIEKLFKDIQLN